MSTQQFSEAERREICADHLGNLRALQRRAGRTPLAPHLAEIPRCLVLPTDPRCGDPQLTKATALDVAGAATHAAGCVDCLEHVDMALELAKAATRAYETACDLLTARPATT